VLLLDRVVAVDRAEQHEDEEREEEGEEGELAAAPVEALLVSERVDEELQRSSSVVSAR
jgi:hypothetical protein